MRNFGRGRTDGRMEPPLWRACVSWLLCRTGEVEDGDVHGEHPCHLGRDPVCHCVYWGGADIFFGGQHGKR